MIWNAIIAVNLSMKNTSIFFFFGQGRSINCKNIYIQKAHKKIKHKQAKEGASPTRDQPTKVQRQKNIKPRNPLEMPPSEQYISICTNAHPSLSIAWPNSLSKLERLLRSQPQSRDNQQKKSVGYQEKEARGKSWATLPETADNREKVVVLKHPSWLKNRNSTHHLDGKYDWKTNLKRKRSKSRWTIG